MTQRIVVRNRVLRKVKDLSKKQDFSQQGQKALIKEELVKVSRRTASPQVWPSLQASEAEHCCRAENKLTK